MKIIHCTGVWPTNIGNAIIDCGAKAMYEKAFPDCEVSFISDYGPYVGRKEDKAFYEIIHDLDIDYFSIGGCCLSYDSIFNFGLDRFNKLKKKNPKLKLLIVGAGIWDYSFDIQYVPELLKMIDPHLFISRDNTSFECSRLLQNTFNGIDCGFFISDYYKSLKINKDYIVAADLRENQTFNNEGKDVIYSFHDTTQSELGYKNKVNFISDIPEGYLRLYANAYKTYSNRVHAAVTCLSYGRPCQIMNLDVIGKRASLFDKVGVQDISQMTYPNNGLIEELKDKQIKFLREHI
jgi:hypothetical protein